MRKLPLSYTTYRSFVGSHNIYSSFIHSSAVSFPCYNGESTNELLFVVSLRVFSTSLFASLQCVLPTSSFSDRAFFFRTKVYLCLLVDHDLITFSQRLAVVFEGINSKAYIYLNVFLCNNSLFSFTTGRRKYSNTPGYTL